MDIKKLISEAFIAQSSSYSPYSGCKVGAALLCKNGKIFRGCNIENASFSATNCAERTAIFKAVSEGINEFEAISIVGNNGNDEFFYPCGICLQVMKEFCDNDFRVIIAKNEDEYKIYNLSELIPFGFDKENVK